MAQPNLQAGHHTSLAPMVRLSTLPLRLLSLERGATWVYTEELPAAKLARSGFRLTGFRLIPSLVHINPHLNDP
jgi:tRNA-dihydrouridine synthase